MLVLSHVLFHNVSTLLMWKNSKLVPDENNNVVSSVLPMTLISHSKIESLILHTCDFQYHRQLCKLQICSTLFHLLKHTNTCAVHRLPLGHTGNSTLHIEDWQQGTL